MDLTPVEQRILGCLLEKQRTTPDQYPLTLNALRLACNQATNRDPVVAWDEATLRPALERLSRRRLIRFASGHGSRVAKYRHLTDETLPLQPDEQAVLAVLLLRGPQTPGELKLRGDRLHAFSGLDAVHAALDRLAARDLVRDAGRRPGQKEDRWEHLLGEAADEPSPAAPAVVTRLAAVDAPISTAAERLSAAPAPIHAPPLGGHDARIAALEALVAELRADLARVVERLDRS